MDEHTWLHGQDDALRSSPWRIIGHEHAVRILGHAASTTSPAHAYLFTGPSHIGKRTLARELAAALNCTAAPLERPCHVCRSCKMTLREAHPDLIFVEKTGDQRVKVEALREARAQVDWRPYEGRYKIYILSDADDWGSIEASANSLLKMLEEPPPQVVVVLTAAQTDALPTTIPSRCRVLGLQPSSPAAIAAGLRAYYGVDGATAERLAALANGRPGWAIEATTSPEMVGQRATAIDRAAALSEGKLSTRLLLAAEVCKGATFLESRAACLEALEDMQVWWRDLLLAASGSTQGPVHGDRIDELRRQAAKRGPARIVRGLREIEGTAGAVERNVTPRLALEALILRLL